METPAPSTPRLRGSDIGNAVLLAVAYVAAARIGLLFDPVGGFASLVWAPSGIALAALLLHGLRLWPGVFVGAFLANLLNGATIPMAAMIGTGNSLGAVIAAAALARLGFDLELHDTRSAIRLVGVAAVGAAVAATIGTTALRLVGDSPVPGAQIWRAWWMGDLIGNLLVTPLVMVWNTRRPHVVAAGRRLEFFGLLLANVAVTALIFSLKPASALAPLAYVLFPGLIWAAVRFGVRGAVTAVTLVAVVAIYGTVNGRGPFVREQLNLSLLGLQAFVGVTAATFIVVGATIAERRAATEDAHRAREDAETANRAKAEFLAVMSHELRTPLNAISGFVDLLLMETHGSVSDGQRRSLERIQANQAHLLMLIDDLLAFTRLEAGRMKLELTTVAVNDVFDQVEPIIQPQLRRREQVFTRGSVDSGLRVTADPDKLAQILVNLLGNAVKYTDDGGTIALGAEAADDLVCLWVRDSGIGIPEDQLDKVFQPFHQVERGRTRRYQGVGLGLTIARDLAHLMNGKLAIQSTLGAGTTISVYLPKA